MGRFLAFALLVLSLIGCGAAMTPVEIAMNGTRSFDAPPAKVFEAVQSALKLEGYEIAIAKPEKGIIKTNRKMVRADAYGQQSAVAVRRQYLITISADGNRTKVEAVPRVFSGEADVSDGSVWVLEGAAGERTLWNTLFKDIEDNL
jgi:hypothetical protein